MTRKQLYILLACLSFAGYAWLGWSFTEHVASAQPPGICLFKATTHLPCPSCGTTRSMVLLMKGDVRGSALLNPLGMVMALALFIVPLWLGVDVVLGRDSLFRWYGKMESLFAKKQWVSVHGIVLVVLNWVWNITKEL